MMIVAMIQELPCVIQTHKATKYRDKFGVLFIRGYYVHSHV